MPEPTMTTDQANEAIAKKTAPKVTKESIEARINSVSHLHHDQLSICIIQMKNDFRVTGESAPASPENYDVAIGERLAYDAAFRKLWAFEGYLLREKLYQDSLPPPPAPPGQPIDAKTA